MKSILKGTIILFLVIYTTQSNAQISRIDYTLSCTLDNISGTEVNIVSNIKKEGNNLIWTQYSNGTNSNNSFNISNTNGTWEINSSQGELAHVLTKEGYALSFKLTGNQSDLFAMLLIQKGAGQIEQYSFTITEITYQ